MSDRPKISGLILKKSKNVFYRLALLFILVWMILLTYISFTIFNLSSHIQNFYNNDLAHVMEVKGYITEYKYKKLDRHDTETIYDLLDKENTEYGFISLCKIASGILIEDSQEGIALYGIYGSDIDILSRNDKNRDVLYSNFAMEKINLLIPEIHMDAESGFYSNRCNAYELKVEKLNNALIENLILNSQNGLPAFFADEETFSDIVAMMFQEEKDSGLIQLEELILYVNDINDVPAAKRMLEENGYVVSHAFNSFESLPAFIVKSSMLHIVVLILLIVFSMAYVYISYKNYINAQKKDMGILKHFGYSKDEILDIYLRPLRMIMLIVLGITFLFNSWQYREWFWWGIVMLFMTLLAYVMYGVIKCFIIKKCVDKNIIDLVKYDKDFE